MFHLPAPKIYLEEYEDLTSKLHHFETMERDLVSKIEAIQAEVKSTKILKILN